MSALNIIKERIEKLNKFHQVEILKLLKISDNTTLNENKNGVFIFEVPNRDSLGFRLARKQWFHLDTPRHLYHFNKLSLKPLLDQQGLKIIEYSGNTIDYWHDLTTSICKCFSTKVPIINKVFYFIFFPIGFTIRTLVSIFMAPTAEINTYVVKHSS